MTINIPIITTEDLVAFRDSHLSSAHQQHFTGQFITGQTTEAEGHEEETYYYEEEEEDDGLGYYPDGTKRTLTDEQIAIFRWSEVWREYKKRLVQDANAKEARNEEPKQQRQTSGERDQQARPKRKWVAPQQEDGGLPYNEEDVEDWEARQPVKLPKTERKEDRTPKLVNRDGFLWPVLGS